MPSERRPHLRLSLRDGHQRDGEIALDDMGKVAEATQRLVRRVARGLTEQSRQGRPKRSFAQATRLYLVGLSSGSTVLEIAAAEEDLDALSGEGMPGDLGEIVLGLITDGCAALSQPEPVLPAGLAASAVEDLDAWLRGMRGYGEVSVETELPTGIRHAKFVPREARRRLKTAQTQPPLPYVTSSLQALAGRLYAVNLRTGNFSIEDDTGHSIRLAVPEDLRDRAAQMINMRVRAIGTPRLGEAGRLTGFELADLNLMPALDLAAQGEFFQRHELTVSGVTVKDDGLDVGVLSDLTDDEVDAFMSALTEQ